MAGSITPFRRGRKSADAPPPITDVIVNQIVAPDAEAAQIAVKSKRAKRVAAAKPDDIAGDPIFAGSQVELALDRISEGRQPRVLANEQLQKSLNDSVKQFGVLQPIRVRPVDATGQKFEIVAGHRRFMAARAAHLSSIPATVAIVDDTSAFVQAMIENLQREDLNPLDEAKALQMLLAESGWTQEVLGTKLGRRQSTISNSLRLLTLAEPVRVAIETGQLSASHGRALAALPEARQMQVAAAAVAQKLPSREVEVRIAKAKEEAKRDEELTAQREAAATKATTALTEWLLLDESRLAKPGDLTIIVNGYGNQHVVDAFAALGVQSRPEKHGEHREPEWTCDEQAVTFTYLDWKGAFVPTCTEESHRTAYVKDRDKEKVRLAGIATKKVDHAKAAVIKAIRSEGGKGLLNIDGMRLALYQLLLSNRSSYGNNGAKAEAFVKRHGGPTNDAKTILPMDVVEAINGLDEKDLGQELATIALNGVFTNLWGDGVSSHQADVDWAMRAHLVAQFGLDADLVWGEVKAPFQVIEAKQTRGIELTADEQAEYDRVIADRDAYKARWETKPAEAVPDSAPTVDGDANDADDQTSGSDDLVD